MSYFEDLARREGHAREQSVVHGLKGQIGLERTQKRLAKVDTRTLSENGLKNFNEATMDASWQEAALQAYQNEITVQAERIRYQSQLIRQMLTLHKISELEKDLVLSDARLAAQDPHTI
ncbi:hypothetical protein BWI97_14380 [Siphonobacter sp. BAB-5405]|uniref:hypothetical protein n=1 Tax=Siphonobacter sp. BAB-5405 TaxID=1864825 RepID=UPI000C800106|nr:hypothetical protein [Siphonobacter sp. BAB-5405]PMD95539.1 hypothetical protein BWI97_14380 [Siphonobacter sp. BAB-5405]